MNRNTMVSVRELRANLPEFLRKASRGQSIVVTSRGHVVARLVPPSPPTDRLRPFGLLKGQIVLAPDFDETPADVISEMEGTVPRRRRR